MGSTNRFHWAAIGGTLSVLKEATRWEVNSLDENHRTPVLLAAASGQERALEVTLKRGGDCTRTDRMGNTALHLAASGGHRRCVESLLEAGCSPFEMNTAGRMALDVARLHRELKVADLLERYVQELELRNPPKVVDLRFRAAKNYEKLKLRYGAVISLNLGDSFRALEEHTVLEESV